MNEITWYVVLCDLLLSLGIVICYGRIVCIPPRDSVEALTPCVAVHGDGASKEVIKGTWGQKNGVLTRQDLCPHKKSKRRQGGARTEESISVHSAVPAIYRPRREALEEPNLPTPLILDSQPPELWGNMFVSLASQSVVFCQWQH